MIEKAREELRDTLDELRESLYDTCNGAGLEGTILARENLGDGWNLFFRIGPMRTRGAGNEIHIFVGGPRKTEHCGNALLLPHLGGIERSHDDVRVPDTIILRALELRRYFINACRACVPELPFRESWAHLPLVHAEKPADYTP